MRDIDRAPVDFLPVDKTYINGIDPKECQGCILNGIRVELDRGEISCKRKPAKNGDLNVTITFKPPMAGDWTDDFLEALANCCEED